MTLPDRLPRLLLLTLLGLSLLNIHTATAAAGEDARVAQSILHTLDYIGVDYPATVRDGEVIDAAEYAEQREFAGALIKQFRRLPEKAVTTEIGDKFARLARLIDDRAEAGQVKALCASLTADIIRNYEVRVSPRHAPALAIAGPLYQQQCASCHGAEGYGDGPAAAGLEPAPNNFHDRTRQAQRSVYGLYSTITLGVGGTAMRGFSELSDNQRWALALYVARFQATDEERARGEALWREGRFQERFASLEDLMQATPAELERELGNDAVAVLAYLRANPGLLEQQGMTAPLAFSRLKLQESLASYQAGQYEQAYQLAVTAYLEGFELSEASLSTVDADIRKKVEHAMAMFRQGITERIDEDSLARQLHEIDELLDQAEHRLATTELSPAMGFTSAVIILLREGLEAILVLAAIVAFLIKSDHREALRYIHAGWIGAMLLGFATWLAARYLIDLSGASREMTEGITALVAAGMLVYVGFWLHSHSHAQRWREFIHGKLHDALGGGTVWSLTAIAFLAVYREIFETILFYEALWQQANAESENYILGGMLSAALVLVVLGWGIFKLGIRLPLRLFFSVNAVLLLGLAIVFAGKGIAALQEAGKLHVSPIQMPTIDLLGIYPTLEGVGLQLALLLGAIAWVGYTRFQDRQRSSA